MDNASTSVEGHQQTKTAKDSLGQNYRLSYEIKRDCVTKADAVVIAAIEAGMPSLVEARTLMT